MSSSVYLTLANSLERIKANSSKAILAVNTNETYINASSDSDLLEIESVFRDEELKTINRCADRYAFIKRKLYDTNLVEQIKIN